MIVLIWGGVVFLSGAERDRAYETSSRQGDNLTRIFEAYISQIFKGTDSALLALRNSYERTLRDFDLKLWVDSAKFQNDLVIQFSVIGRDGIMKSSTLASSGPPIDLSDRDHFRYHAHATTDDLFISPPVLGRVSGKATVQLARKLRAPDGSFGGVILASLDIQQVENFYNSIDVGRSGTITLVGFDGIIRARSTRQDDPGKFIGRSMAGSRVFELYPTSPTGSLLDPTGYRLPDGWRLPAHFISRGRRTANDRDRRSGQGRHLRAGVAEDNSIPPGRFRTDGVLARCDRLRRGPAVTPRFHDDGSRKLQAIARTNQYTVQCGAPKHGARALHVRWRAAPDRLQQAV